MKLTINQATFEVKSEAELRAALSPFETLEFREIWLNFPAGPALCALLNRQIGWLMYLRKDGDSGFSSRNSSYFGNADDVIEYRLNNGQSDEYPASWAFSETDVVKALCYFVEQRERPPFITWHEV
jgi:Immunity protein Imm1